MDTYHLGMSKGMTVQPAYNDYGILSRESVLLVYGSLPPKYVMEKRHYNISMSCLEIENHCRTTNTQVVLLRRPRKCIENCQTY